MTETYLIYRDGEEVEVGWLTKKLDDLCRFWSVCRVTDWLHYFQPNGPGEVVRKEFTGFRKFSNQEIVEGQWIICIKGGIRPIDGSMYWRSVTGSYLDQCVEYNWPGMMKARMDRAETLLDLYATSDCTCRIGFHRRCPHHHTTQN